jgi:hypothetical protein
LLLRNGLGHSGWFEAPSDLHQMRGPGHSRQYA